jgi:hypothetical protein
LNAEEIKKVVAWKPIEDASGYQIQIKDKNGTKIVDKQIQKSFYSVEELSTGDYFVRTAPLNSFKKPVVWSNWRELEILFSEPPKVFIESKKAEILISSKENSKIPETSNIAIKGDNFLDVTEVEIKKESFKLPILQKETVTKERMNVKVDTKDAKPGDYDLTVTNPYQKPKVVSNFLKIEDQSKEESSSKSNSEKTNISTTDTSKKPVSETIADTKQETKKDVKPPQGKLINDYSYEEMMKFLETNVAENCKQTKIPAITLGECNQTFVTVNESTDLNKNIFIFYKLIGSNSTERISAYAHFGANCKPTFRPAKEKMERLWNARQDLDPEERFFLNQGLTKIRNCP